MLLPCWLISCRLDLALLQFYRRMPFLQSCWQSSACCAIQLRTPSCTISLPPFQGRAIADLHASVDVDLADSMVQCCLQVTSAYVSPCVLNLVPDDADLILVEFTLNDSIQNQFKRLDDLTT